MLNLKRFFFNLTIYFLVSDYSIKQHIKVSHLCRADQTENFADRGIAHPLYKHAFVLRFRHFELDRFARNPGPVDRHLVIPHEA